MTVEQLFEVVRTTVASAEYCFLTTLNQHGEMHTRLMQPFPLEDDLSIWFGTSPRARKVQDIRSNSHAAVAYQPSLEPAYVSFIGAGRFDDDLDRRRHYWYEDWLTFFPAGPAGDDYALIKFVPWRIEVMNFAQQVAPSPFGLKPAVLVREGEAWSVEERSEE
jgi:general stress protein 26